MGAATITAEIQRPPPAEQAEVLEFVRAIDRKGPWTSAKLTAAAEQIIVEEKPWQAKAIWERIAAGFYGEKTGA